MFDKEYHEEEFKSKINNMFIQVLYAIMLQDIDRVRHFLNEDLEKQLEQKIEGLKQKNLRQMYDELNVADVKLINITEMKDRFVIDAEITSKYMDYQMDMQGKIISGDSSRRVQKIHFLTCERYKNGKSLGLVRRCKSCGHSMNLSLNGKCEYCGSIYKLEDYDYVITKLNFNEL